MINAKEITIGKGTWLDKIAFNIIEREKKLSRSLDDINVESGIGASGIPHIGSMGDAVRAFGISLALKNMGYQSVLITFSDDLDGLRKIPYGLPKWLSSYLCKPVSAIPDPFGDCHESYGMHMSNLLLDGLDKCNVKYKFKSGTEIYKSGILSSQIHEILTKSNQIGNKIAEITGQQRYTTYLPYFPICEQCGRLYVANATKYLENERSVIYSCNGNIIGGKKIEGCGYEGETKIESGGGKLAWKVEFAARWKAFDIRFEAFGKDIMDSVKINDWVASEILKFYHPFHVKYEMFLDKGGKKISKSAGNVLSPQTWLKYGHAQSLLLLFYKRISGTRSVAINDIPLLMDEYDGYEDIYFGKTIESNKSKQIKIKGIYEYINNFEPPNVNQIHVPYRILLQQAELFIDQTSGEELEDKIFDRLTKYRIVTEKDRSDPFFKKKIDLSINWAKDFKDIGYEETAEMIDTRIEIDQENLKKALDNIKHQLLELSKEDNIYYNINSSARGINKEGSQLIEGLNDKVQTIIFENAKENKIPPKDLFRLLYRILINSEKGPRLGNYIVDLGLRNVINIIERKVK